MLFDSKLYTNEYPKNILRYLICFSRTSSYSKKKTTKKKATLYMIRIFNLLCIGLTIPKK